MTLPAPSAAVGGTPRWAAAMAVLALLGIAAYAGLSHVLMVHAAREPWAVAVLFGPLIAAVAGTAWRARQGWVLAACAAAVGVLVFTVLRGGVDDMNRLYVLQHGGIHLALAWAFGHTLLPGHTPLITALARTVHLNFTEDMQRYTRRLTAAWAAYFVGMVGLSVVLYALAPWPWWSFFCNVLTPLFAALAFVGEHLLRYRRHPEFERVSMRTAVAAYRQRAAQPPHQPS